MIDRSKFSKTENRILDILFDGELHEGDDLVHQVYGDSVSTICNLRPHITNIRKKLQGTGLLLNFVVANGRRNKGYQITRKLHSSKD